MRYDLFPDTRLNAESPEPEAPRPYRLEPLVMPEPMTGEPSTNFVLRCMQSVNDYVNGPVREAIERLKGK